MQFSIPEQDLPTFVIMLALGTLSAIHTETVPATVGIWTLGKPRFWEPLMNKPGISAELISIIQTFDELSAIKEIVPVKFEQALEKLKQRLLAELAQIQDPDWQLLWKREDKQHL